MTDLDSVQKHAEVIGADGVHVVTVDSIHGDRMRLTRGLVVAVENGVVRLTANSDVAVTLETRHQYCILASIVNRRARKDTQQK